MLTKVQKSEIVKDIAEKFKRQKIAIFTDFRGVSVTKLSILRRLLKKDDAEYKVAKKTLFGRALEEAKSDISVKDMQGEIGVAFGYGDQVAPARVLVKFGKEADTFRVLGGLLGGRILTDKEVIALAKLPGREVLLAHVVGALSAPLCGLARALQGNIRNLAFVLGKIRDNKNK